MNKYQKEQPQRTENAAALTEAGGYSPEEEARMEKYIEDKRLEFYEEWAEYLARDEED